MGQCLEKLEEERLQDLLHYDPESGFFFWKESRGRVRKGELAGCVSERKSDGYKRIAIGVDGVTYYAHQLSWLYMTGVFPDFEIDHENGNSLDNRWSNLRRGDSGVNGKNRKKYSVNTSGHNGVSWCKRDRKWRAYCTIGGKMKSLGYYNDYDEACNASSNYRVANNFSKRHGL